MNSEERKDLIKQAKQLLIDIILGKEAPRDRDGYLFWWLTRLKFMSPELYVPVRAAKAIHMRAENKSQKLSQYLLQLIEQPRHRWTYAKNLVLNDEQKQFQLRLEAIVEKIKEDKPDIFNTESVFSSEADPRNFIQIPITLEILAKKGVAPDKAKILQDVKRVFASGVGEQFKKALNMEAYSGLVISKTNDAIRVFIPDVYAISDSQKKSDEVELRQAINSKFNTKNFILEWRDGAWYVTLPKHRHDKDVVFLVESIDCGYEFKELITLNPIPSRI